MKSIYLNSRRDWIFFHLFCLSLTTAFLSQCSDVKKSDAVKTAASNDSGAIALSPQIPTDVNIPSDFPSNQNPIAFFDDYSWKAFIALMWPAKDGQRGEADISKSISTPGPRVFQTYKSLAEIFLDQGATPTDWNKYDNLNACNVTPGFGQMVLASFSKFGNLGQAGFGNLVGPLPCQNGTYTRYFTLFNETEFNAILQNKWFLRSNLSSTITFPNGSIDMKCAWIDMEGIKHPERYYTDSAFVMDTINNTCSKRLVGLTGIHIVQKTPSRPQWIWSTFEQIDNLPQTGGTAPFAYNDDTGTPMPKNNPDVLDPLTLPPTKYNVTRTQPIHPSTQATNVKYQNILKQNNSVLQYYQLVMTQWPLQLNPPNPIPATQDGTTGNTFPGTGASTSFANCTMETFDQDNIRKGCMNCHTLTQNTDFLWTLEDHAFPSTVPNVRLKAAKSTLTISSTKLQQMKQLMESK